ncbi:ATP synthase subunit O, mitochondrial-like [Daphnia pulex]|uniref:ATP synthase subunit O, mitochondrial-like n=2 Tax=Daphnia TaxID=6668 RepID=UPI001EE0007F|nr:ATP synthase subunit O, mitochondrial-like [Daphnia pulex]
MAATKFGVLARNFSTSSSSQQLVKAPVQVFGLYGRYASALYSAASKQKSLDKVESELKDFHATIAKDSRLAEFIANPTLKRSLKKDALISVAKKLKMSAVTGNFLELLAENGRLNKLDVVTGHFFNMMAAFRGEVVCEVTSAKALDAATLKEVTAALSGFLQKGQSLKISTKVDPSIVGGLVVVLGDRYIDMSLASKIERYTTLLKQPV